MQHIGTASRRPEARRAMCGEYRAARMAAVRVAAIAGAAAADARAALLLVIPLQLRQSYRCDADTRTPYWVGLRGCAVGSSGIMRAATNKFSLILCRTPAADVLRGQHKATAQGRKTHKKGLLRVLKFNSAAAFFCTHNQRNYLFLAWLFTHSKTSGS